WEVRLHILVRRRWVGTPLFSAFCYSAAVDSPHYPHPLQLTAAHARPLQRDLLSLEVSVWGHFYSVREGTLSKSFNRCFSSYGGKLSIFSFVNSEAKAFSCSVEERNRSAGTRNFFLVGQPPVSTTT